MTAILYNCVMQIFRCKPFSHKHLLNLAVRLIPDRIAGADSLENPGPFARVILAYSINLKAAAGKNWRRFHASTLAADSSGYCSLLFFLKRRFCLCGFFCKEILHREHTPAALQVFVFHAASDDRLLDFQGRCSLLQPQRL